MSNQKTPSAQPPSVAPYMLRAIWQWIHDQGHTPHILVNALAPGVDVPKHTINADGKVVLNIAEHSVKYLKMDDDSVSFGASFNGRHHSVFVPMYSILAIFSRESGHGCALEAAHPKHNPLPNGNGFKPPTLVVVASSDQVPGHAVGDASTQVQSSSTTAADAAPEEETPKPPRQRGHLSIVK